MGVAKTRMIAKHLCDKGKILLNGKPLKPSQEVFGGEILEVILPQKELQLKVLEIPAEKSVAKPERVRFFTLLSVKEL